MGSGDEAVLSAEALIACGPVGRVDIGCHSDIRGDDLGSATLVQERLRCGESCLATAFVKNQRPAGRLMKTAQQFVR